MLKKKAGQCPPLILPRLPVERVAANLTVSVLQNL
jgi:hypothetical protein